MGVIVIAKVNRVDSTLFRCIKEEDTFISGVKRVRYKDLSEKDIIDNLSRVENAELVGGRVKLYNISEKRIAQIGTTGKIEKAAIVITREVRGKGGIKGYTMVDPNGNVVTKGISEAIRLSKLIGITNYRLVERGGKEGLYSLGWKRIQSNPVKESKIENRKLGFLRYIREPEKYTEYLNSIGDSEYIGVREDRTVEDFIKYNKGINKFSLDGTQLTIVSNPIINIPSGIKHVKVIADVGHNIEPVIFIGKDVVGLECEGEYYEIHSRYRENTIIFDGKPIILSNNIKILEGYDYGKIPSGVEKLYQCYYYSLSEEVSTIKIPNRVNEISNSFRGINVTNIDFSDATELEELRGGSFSDLKEIRELDLSNCKNLRRIGWGCFNNMPALESVILPKNLEIMEGNCFYGCKSIKRFIIGDNLKILSIGVFGTKEFRAKPIDVIMHKDTEVSSKMKINTIFKDTNVLRNGQIDGANIETLDISCVNRIADKALIGTGVANIKFCNELTEIGNESFAEVYGMDIIDMSNTKLEKIGNKAFSGSSVKCIILPETVKYIGDSAFINMPNLKYIYIPSGVLKLGNRLFSKSGEAYANGVTVLTEISGNAAKKKGANINIRDTKSSKEAIEYIRSKVSVSEKEKAKVGLITGLKSEYYDLRDERFISRASELIVIIDKLKKEDKESIKGVELNRGNTYKNLKIHQILGDTIKNSEIRGEDHYTGVVIYDKVKNMSTYAFRSLCNLYMGILDKVEEEKLIKLTNKCKIGYTQVIAKSAEGEMICASIKYEDEAMRLLLICEEENVLYGIITDKHMSSIYKCSESEFSGIMDYLEIGKEYPVNYIDTSIPTQFREIIASKIRGNLVDLYLERKSKDRAYGVFLCPSSGDIIQALITSRSIIGDQLDVNKVKAIAIQSRTRLDKASNEIKDKIIESKISQTGVKEFIERVSGVDIDNLKMYENAYDRLYPIKDWELARNWVGIQDIDGIKKLLDTSFFVRKSTKAENLYGLDIVDNKIIGGYRVITVRVGGNRKRVQTVYGEARYITTVLKYKDDIAQLIQNNKSIKVWYSVATLDMVQKVLGDMYNTEAKNHIGIDNNPVNERDFYNIKYGMTGYADNNKHNYIVRCSISINKANGVLFILVKIRDTTISDERVYKLFRLNQSSIEEALEKHKWINGEYIGNIRYFDSWEIVKYFNGGKSDNTVLKVRDFILEGYPREYPMSIKNKYIFDRVATQPEQIKDNRGE